MATIVTRAGKGSPLTNAEVDANFTNLNNQLATALFGANNLSDLANVSTARSNLGVAIGTHVQAWDADLDAIAAIAGTSGLLKKTAANTWALDTSTYLTGITSSQVATALGFTPYNATNPSGYITGINSSMVTTALGFTPYNATNPSGYITSSSLSSYLPLTGGTLTGNLSWTSSGTNYVGNGNGDAASYATYNLKIRSWNGIGFPSYDDVNRIFFDTRSGGINGLGALTMGGNVTAYSDETLKTNWRPLGSDFIEKLAELKSGIYDRLDTEITQVGVSAQGLRKFMQHAVQSNDSGILSVAYGNAALVSAVELARELVALKKYVKSKLG